MTYAINNIAMDSFLIWLATSPNLTILAIQARTRPSCLVCLSHLVVEVVHLGVETNYG